MLSILMLMKDDLFDGKQQSDRAKSNKNIEIWKRKFSISAVMLYPHHWLWDSSLLKYALFFDNEGNKGINYCMMINANLMIPHIVFNEKGKLLFFCCRYCL